MLNKMHEKEIIQSADCISYLFTDIRGLLMQVSREKSKNWNALDILSKIAVSGSMIPGWQDNAESDLYLVPDTNWASLDPTSERPRILVFSNPVDPYSQETYPKDVRSVCSRLNKFIKSENIADTIQIGPELEFHVFDGVRFSTTQSENFVFLSEVDGWENNSHDLTSGHRVGHASMHFATPPIDQFRGLRDEIAKALVCVGIDVIHHTHEAGPSQQEIGVLHKEMLRAADEVQLQKMIVKAIATQKQKTVTFMPRPIPYSQGNGLHINISLWKDGKNLFYGGEANKLSKKAHSFVAGVLNHIKALNAITNPSTNSYARLRYLFSLMRNASYGYRNRSTEIRVPHFESENECRLEIRFPDPSCNPYLAFPAITLAGLNGMLHEAEAPEPIVVNPKWYDMPLDPRQIAEKTIAPDLLTALQSLDKDREFLTKSGVFSDTLIDSIISDGAFFSHWNATTPSPQEFQVHFSL
jgi:glutamine synthetase